ncbi:MAG: hypothetical protein ACR2PG_01520, partial [Hyphomicrobiaceae bacterium]
GLSLRLALERSLLRETRCFVAREFQRARLPRQTPGHPHPDITPDWQSQAFAELSIGSLRCWASCRRASFANCERET